MKHLILANGLVAGLYLLFLFGLEVVIVLRGENALLLTDMGFVILGMPFLLVVVNFRILPRSAELTARLIFVFFLFVLACFLVYLEILFVRDLFRPLLAWMF